MRNPCKQAQPKEAGSEGGLNSVACAGSVFSTVCTWYEKQWNGQVAVKMGHGWPSKTNRGTFETFLKEQLPPKPYRQPNPAVKL